MRCTGPLLVLGTVAWLTFATASAVELPSPEKAVVLDIDEGWDATDWGHGGGRQLCGTARSERLAGGGVRLLVTEPGTMRVWQRHLALPIDGNRYPILVMRYRATDMNTRAWWYCMWVRCPMPFNNKGITAVDLHEIQFDGQIHTLRHDLRDYWIGPPREGMSDVALAVVATAAGPASFELLELRFETPPEDDRQALANHAPLTVIAVDAEGQPLAGAEVTVDAERRNFARQARSDARGRAVVTPVSNETGTHLVRVAHPGFVTADATVTLEELAKPVQVRLAPAARYGGVVRDEQGRPIPGVRVVGHLTDKENKPLAEPDFQVLTDAAGRWVSPPLPNDLPVLPIRLSHPNFVDDVVTEQWRTPAMGLLAERADMQTLRRGEPLTGLVVDEEGRPLAGAVVRAGPFPWNDQMVTRHTDGQGHFAFTHLPAGTPRLVAAQADGYAMAAIQLGEVVDPQPQTFWMHKAPPLRVRFIDPDGQPVHGACMRVEKWLDMECSFLRGRSGPDGRLAWTSVPDTGATYRVIVKGYMPRTGLQFPDRGKEQVIVLQPFGR